MHAVAAPVVVPFTMRVSVDADLRLPLFLAGGINKRPREEEVTHANDSMSIDTRAAASNEAAQADDDASSGAGKQARTAAAIADSQMKDVSANQLPKADEGSCVILVSAKKLLRSSSCRCCGGLPAWHGKQKKGWQMQECTTRLLHGRHPKSTC